MSRATTTIPLLLLTMFAELCIADGPALEHNPFARPPSAASTNPRASITPDGVIRIIDLRATIVAEGKGLANVDGKILRPGDIVQGATLLKVFEDRAIFLHNEERLTVYVKPETVDSDE